MGKLRLEVGLITAHHIQPLLFKLVSVSKRCRIVSVVLYLSLKFLGFVIELLQPSLQLADEFLAEVASFGQLGLDLLVYLDISSERFDVLEQLLVLEEQLFGLFRLVLEFGSKLVIL